MQTLGIQGKLHRCSEKTEEAGGLLAEARGEVYKGQEERGTVQMWRGMVGCREAGWLGAGSTWGEQTHAMVSTRAWTRWHLEVVESLGLRDCSPTRIPVPLDYAKKQLCVNGGRDLPPALGSP